jgi:hypothetical protein
VTLLCFTTTQLNINAKVVKSDVFFVFATSKKCFAFDITEIQEFYEVTLCDDDKSLQQKTVETLQIATKWEHQPPVHLSEASSSLTALPQSNAVAPRSDLDSVLV